MAEEELFEKIKALPPDLKQEVASYVDYVWEKRAGLKPYATGAQRSFGLLKGRMWMSPDFDEPLDDLKEYME